MFSGSAYTGADGGFGGVFGRGTPDLDEHPDSERARRAAWLSVEEEAEEETDGSGGSQIALAALLNQRDRDLIAKHNQMLMENREPARRMMQSLQEHIPGIGTEPSAAAPLAEPAAIATAAEAPPATPTAAALPRATPTARAAASPRLSVAADAPGTGTPTKRTARTKAQRAGSLRLANSGTRSSARSAARDAKSEGAKTPRKVGMSREQLERDFAAKHGDALAVASDLWYGGGGDREGCSTLSLYLFELGMFDHNIEVEKAFKELFPTHPVTKESLMALDKPDLDRLIRTAGVNVHDAAKLRSILLPKPVGPLSVPGDEHFDKHFDPTRVKISNTQWDQSADDSVPAESPVLRFEGSPERRSDSKVIKSPSLGSEGLSFRSSGRTRAPYEETDTRDRNGEYRSLRSMREERAANNVHLTTALGVRDVAPGGHKLRQAAREGRLEDLRKLLHKHKNSHNDADAQGRSALLLAAEAGHSDCVEELLRRGSDPNLFAHEKEGKQSPLTVAAMNGHQACVKLLLGKNATPDHASDQGTALLLAVKAGHIPCVRTLLTHKADVEAANTKGQRPLFIAAMMGRFDCLNALLEHDPTPKLDVDSNESRRTAFMVACQLGREDCVQALVSAGCDKEHRDKAGKTGLMLACAMGHRQIVEYLVAEGCDTEAKDKDGKTASDLAKSGPVTDYFKERSAGAEEELMAMLQREEVSGQANQKGKKKKKQKKKKQQKQNDSKTETGIELEPEPEPEPELEPEPRPEFDQPAADSGLGLPSKSEPKDEPESPDADSPKPATLPKSKKKNKKKGSANASAVETDDDVKPGTSPATTQERSNNEELLRLRQEITAAASTAAANSEQRAQQETAGLKRENKALQWKVEALERRLAEQASAMAAQESEFSARIEESWQDSITLREENAALQRDRDIAQHEAAQYRRHKEELETALAERKDDSDVSWRARSESEVLLMNDNQRLRAENKDLNEMLDKERTAATHANHQFQAHMQQMNAASFDQGTRLQQANDIIRQLQMGKAIEHADADALRRQRADYMLHQLQIITNNWIHEIGEARGIHQAQAGMAPLRAYLFTFGSFRLEVDDTSSDVDVLVMVSPQVDREADFFGLGRGPERTHQCPSLLSRLQQDERVSGVVAVSDAYVPCIKMSFGGIDFDLTFANVLRSELPQQSEWGDDVHSWRAGPGNFAVDGAMHALAHDLPAVRSFVGVHATHCVLRSMQQHYETFRQTLVQVKAWAKRQGIYGSMMGYPGGVAWTLLTAFYCRERFSAMPPGSHTPPTVGNMLAGFFALWSGWSWPEPVELVERASRTEQQHPVLDAEVWRALPGSPGGSGGASAAGAGAGGDARMPIISPAYPQMNTTHTVGAASFRVIQEELSAAAQLSSSAGIGGCCASTWPSHSHVFCRKASQL
jgi:poly(A) polymerase Pap1/ankyrin repeat protein